MDDFNVQSTRADALTQAGYDMADALTDYESAILRSVTTKDALTLHLTLATVTARAMRLEKLALDRADALCGGQS
jgi:hypothetical protein